MKNLHLDHLESVLTPLSDTFLQLSLLSPTLHLLRLLKSLSSDLIYIDPLNLCIITSDQSRSIIYIIYTLLIYLILKTPQSRN